MSPAGTREDLRAQILEEAAGWVIELNDGQLDDTARRDFNRWIRRSPEHILAYLEIAATWDQSTALDRRAALDPATLIREALREHESNVVPFGPTPAVLVPAPAVAASPEGASQTRPRGRRRSFASWGIAVAATLAAAGVALWAFVEQNSYSTGIGEQRSVALSDGSTLQLNSHSRLRVSYTQHERAVDLIDGQALFEVNKDATRPFVVRIGNTRVRALGTQFDVYRKNGATVITVVNGRVAVSQETSRQGAPPNAAGGVEPPREKDAIALAAGEQLVVTPQEETHVVTTHAVDAIAWTQRKIVFDETLLKDAVAEFNRYSRTRIVIESPELETFHVRGTFSTLHPETLAQFLQQRFGVTVTKKADEIRISGLTKPR